MKLADAQKLAGEIIKALQPLCERVEVAGSIRRKKIEVRDVDIVLCPRPLVDIVGALQRNEVKVVKRGARVVNLEINGVDVDLNFCREDEFAPMLLFRTGSWQHNQKLATQAKRMGLKFSPYGVFRGDKRIDDNTEEGIFSAMGEDYVSPEKRD